MEAVDRFNIAYCQALTTFADALAKIDPRDESQFKPILRLTVTFRLGHLSMSEIAARINIGKGTISRWLSSSMMPSAFGREMVLRCIHDAVVQQISEMSVPNIEAP